MISLVILLLLALGVMTGVRRGVVLQAGHLLSLIISFIVALSFYEELATKFRLWVPYPSTLDDAGIDLTMFAIPSSARRDEVFYKAFSFRFSRYRMRSQTRVWQASSSNIHRSLRIG